MAEGLRLVRYRYPCLIRNTSCGPPLGTVQANNEDLC